MPVTRRNSRVRQTDICGLSRLKKNGACEIAYSDGISCVCGEIAVIPPFVKCGYATRGEVLLALIEQPLTGLKIPAKSAEVFVRRKNFQSSAEAGRFCPRWAICWSAISTLRSEAKQKRP